ncbi:MAG: 4-hydroxy-tetrahydrodipicolinate reductase [Deltaproteobacteria bacterium]|nr:MAG: 4-hydroxy-tetrahydrodipicolinate reductase [Deltaproteobacteria bacterium]
MRTVPVIIMGAKGRMGSILCRMAEDDPDLTLAGLVERKDWQQDLERFACPVVEDVDKLMAIPGAVIIDFTLPRVTLDTAAKAAKHSVPMIIGTTGFTPEEQARLDDLADKVPLFLAPNMSVGIYALLRCLPDLVRILGQNYDLEVMELHHRHKKDAPSGTALKLAECLARARDKTLEEVGTFSRHGMIGERNQGEIGVQALRGGDVVGDHVVYCLGPGERLEVTHRAHSRETFASGALRAAKWIGSQKPGKLYGMEDMLG